MRLLTVSQATKSILKTKMATQITECPLNKAYGRSLAENVSANRDQPSADRSSMDGIALRFLTWERGCRDFDIQGVQRAGVPAKTLRKVNGCFEIMTGALIPNGCDTVVPIENVTIGNHFAWVNREIVIKRFEFIRRQGCEHKKGTLLLGSGTRLNATHIAVAASVGKRTLKVFDPKIAVIGTGDELVEPGIPCQTHQNYRSNAYALESLLSSNGFAGVKLFHANDNLEKLKRITYGILKKFDVIIFSGGVSKGKFDFLPQALSDLGVKTVFHQVLQKPGKPLLFGLSPDEKPVFGLPGNPVSTLICAVRYVVPYLNKICGHETPSSLVRLGTMVKQHSILTLFLPVKIKRNAVYLSQFAGSGDYGALVKTAGFVEIPSGRGHLSKGKTVRFFSW